MNHRRIFLYFFAALLCLTAAVVLGACVGANGPDAGINTLQPTAEPGPTPPPRDTSNDTTLAASMVLANNEANHISMRYDTAERRNYILHNIDSTINIRLWGSSSSGVYSLVLKDGRTLIEGGMTGYVVTNDGVRYTMENSNTGGRINGNKWGYYYFEVNLRGYNFVKEDTASDIASQNDTDIMIRDKAALSANQITDPEIKDGIISASVTDGLDPYLVMPVAAKIGNANMIKLEMAVTGETTGGSIYYYTVGQKGFAAERAISFNVVSDGEYHTYLIDLSGADLASDTMASLRFDLNGSAVGDTFKIRAVKFSHTDAPLAIPCGYEQTLHTYTDKYHNELRLLYDEETGNYKEFGYEYRIPVDKVASLQFATDSGTYTSVSDFNGSTLKYIAFDIKDAGVFGVIIPNDGMTGSALAVIDGNYVFRNFIDISGRHRAGTDSVFGHRVYYSAEHGFDGIVQETYFEHNPLTVSTEKINSYSGFQFVEYDKVVGAYKFTLNGLSFQDAFSRRKNDYFGGTILFEGDGQYDRKVYVWANGSSGGLEGAVVLDDRMVLTPLQVEVCKNFQGEVEEPYYDPNDPAYGDSYYPLLVKKDETLTHTLLNLFQNWGNNKLKQVSSVSFHIAYYHISTGVTETNCIAPYFVHGRDGWVLPDFRTMSAELWDGQPQHNSVGRLRFLSYVDAQGKKLRTEYIDSKILSSGTAYADVEYSYRSDCASFEFTLRHMEFPQDDENRTYYRMDLVVHRDITIADVRKNFTLFDIDSCFVPLETLSYKDANGQIVNVANNNTSVTDPSIYVLGKENPFFSYYDYEKDPAYPCSMSNYAFIVKDYSVTLGGKKWDGNLVLRNSTILDGGTYLNFAEISLDLGDTAFKAGDTISLVFILLPYGAENQKDDPNVHYVIEDSIENPWRVKSAEIGTIVEDDYLAMVDCVNNEAQFTVTGGRNASVVRVNGFTKLVRPKLQELVNGAWVDVDFSYEDYDGYQVNYTFDGNYSYSFVIYMEKPTDERTFRVVAE